MSENESGAVAHITRRRSAKIRSAQAAENGPALEIIPDEDSLQAWQKVLQETLGIDDPALATMLLGQLANQLAAEPGNGSSNDNGAKDFSDALNGALAAIASLAPSDSAEAMLAVQMVTSHTMALEMNRRARRAETPHTVSGYSNLAGKFMRLYIDQMGRLARNRGTAHQTVRVERVTIEDGGQAIVGPVTASPPSTAESS